ncbi:hypothetical protein ACXR0O_26690 [Verrucomicrobiota bacterium sgz303538]
MIRPLRLLAGALASLSLCVLVSAQESAAPAPLQPLSAETIAGAAKVDSLSIPTPGELMAALNKLGKPDWPGQYRPPIATSYSSRAQMALNLGGLIADGYIAVQAEDAQQVKNIGKDIIALAKPLGVQQDIINRGKSLTEFAENGKWDVLKEELEATQNEVKAAMAENKDQSLITLVTVGGWIRGTEVVSNYIANHYSEGAAKLLRQPGIVRFLYEQLDTLPEKVRDDPAVKKTRVKLLEIEQTVTFPRNATPDVESVKKLNTLTSDLMKEIAKKDIK